MDFLLQHYTACVALRLTLVKHPVLIINQPCTSALFSTLLAGGRDPGEYWSRGSQILGATNIGEKVGGTC